MMTLKKQVNEHNFEEAPPQVNEFKRFFRVFMGRKVVIFGFFIIALLIIAGFLHITP